MAVGYLRDAARSLQALSVVARLSRNRRHSFWIRVPEEGFELSFFGSSKALQKRVLVSYLLSDAALAASPWRLYPASASAAGAATSGSSATAPPSAVSSGRGDISGGGGRGRSLMESTLSRAARHGSL